MDTVDSDAHDVDMVEGKGNKYYPHLLHTDPHFIYATQCTTHVDKSPEKVG